MSRSYDDLVVGTRAQWRAWLAEHHATVRGVWLVTGTKGSGHPVVGYPEQVEEALCFGWVDSQAQRREHGFTALLMTPRRAASAWSRSNKERVARLEEQGLMTEAGRAVVEAAKLRGTWTALDAVERLEEPPDLRAALDARPDARRHWDAFPRSAKRGILEWVTSAKRAETRQRRVAETAELAERGRRAHQWPPER